MTMTMQEWQDEMQNKCNALYTAYSNLHEHADNLVLVTDMDTFSPMEIEAKMGKAMTQIDDVKRAMRRI